MASYERVRPLRLNYAPLSYAQWKHVFQYVSVVIPWTTPRHRASSASGRAIKMLNDSRLEYISIRAVILFLHSIGPLCTVYTLTLTRRAFMAIRGTRLEAIVQSALHQAQWPNLNALQWWCAAETAFYVFFLWYRTQLQREAIHPPLRSKAERKALFDKVKSEIHDPEKFMSGWFRGAKIEEIGREDLKEFLSWTFWEGRTTKNDEEELEVYTREVETMVGAKRFKPGRGTAKGLRLTLDPIDMHCRSLTWYLIIMLVDTATHARLLWYGMKYHGTTAATLAVFPPRPLALASSAAPLPARDLAYWLRPHTSKTRLPIVFLHGIGVGLHPYIDFFHETDIALNACADADDQVGILVVEVLQISSRLTSAIITRINFLDQMTTMLDHYGWERFVLVSHSYGSVLSTYMLTDEVMASRTAAMMLIDPVTILLHMPDVAYNFTARQPRKANEWQLWYFASKDPGVSHVLGRHFFWSQNILWREQILELVKGGMRMTVSLAQRDLIVDTDAVGSYLTENKMPDPVVVRGETNQKRMELRARDEKEKVDAKVNWKTRKFSGKGLEILWWDDLDHAQVFDVPGARAKLVDVLVEYCKGD